MALNAAGSVMSRFITQPPFRTHCGKMVMTIMTLCSLVAAGAALAKQGDGLAGALSFANVWIEGTSLGDSMASVHIDIVNHGTESDELVAAFSPDCESVVLHKPRAVLSARQDLTDAPRVEVSAGGMLAVGRSGVKVLLVEPSQPLRPGSTLALTLRFRKAGDMTIDLPTRATEQRP